MMASVLASPNTHPHPPPAAVDANAAGDAEPLSPASVQSGHDFTAEAEMMASVLASPHPLPHPPQAADDATAADDAEPL